MAGTDRDGRRELTWLLAEEAQAAADRIAAEVRTMETQPGAASATSLASMRASVRALQAALTKMLDVHGALRSVARPERAQVDAIAVAGEVAEEVMSEGMPVRVESRTPSAMFYADAGELRRVLRLLVERAASTGEEIPGGWVVLSVSVSGDEVIYEVPWAEAGTAADEAEREWLQRAVRRQAGVLTTAGGTARVVLSSVVRTNPGDADPLAQEVEALRRRSELYVLELDAARRQGEAYARDVADLFAEVEARDAAMVALAQRWDRAARASTAVARDVRKSLALIARQAETLAPRGGPPSEVAAAILVHLRGAAGVVKRLKDVFHDPPRPEPPGSGTTGGGAGHG